MMLAIRYPCWSLLAILLLQTTSKLLQPRLPTTPRGLYMICWKIPPSFLNSSTGAGKALQQKASILRDLFEVHIHRACPLSVIFVTEQARSRAVAEDNVLTAQEGPRLCPSGFVSSAGSQCSPAGTCFKSASMTCILADLAKKALPDGCCCCLSASEDPSI